MIKVKALHAINGIAVPVSETGVYLDWREVTGEDDDLRAPVLTSPYGPAHFIVGDDSTYVVLDYAVLPNGRFVLQADVHGGEDLLHPEDLYNLYDREEAPEAAFRLVDKCLDALGRLGISHVGDVTEGWACDAWYFARAVARASGCDHYSDWDDVELRFGR